MSEEVDAEVIEGEQVESPDVETEVVDTETETPEPSESSPEKTESDKIQERIDKATKRQRTAERDAEYWREMAMKREPEPVKPAPLEVKTLEDFDYDEKAYQAHLIEVSTANATEAARRVIDEEKRNNDAQARQREFQSKEKEYAKEVKDYMEVTRDESLSLTKDMVEIASSSDSGPAILYHLAKNPDLSASLAALPPLVAAREIGKIEARLSKEPKSSSNAPPPPPKIKGGDPVIKKSPEDMTQKEFNAYRRKVIANRGN